MPASRALMMSVVWEAVAAISVWVRTVKSSGPREPPSGLWNSFLISATASSMPWSSYAEAMTDQA